MVDTIMRIDLNVNIWSLMGQYIHQFHTEKIYRCIARKKMVQFRQYLRNDIDLTLRSGRFEV